MAEGGTSYIVVARARRRVLTVNRAKWLALSLDRGEHLHAAWRRCRIGYLVVLERRVPAPMRYTPPGGFSSALARAPRKSADQ